MRILNILAAGGIGGIETLFRDIILNSEFTNYACCLFQEGEIFNELKNKGIEVFSTEPVKKDIFKIVNIISDFCRKKNVDIITIHHGGIKCNLIYILLKKKNPHIKHVRYLHSCFDKYSFGNGESKFKDIIVKKVMQKAFDVSDLLIFISEAVKKTFEDNFRISKSVVIYNGIRNEFFERPNVEQKVKNKINIVFVGRVVKVKGVDYLLEAFYILSQKYSNLSLRIVGDGDQRVILENKSRELGLNDRVFFEGRQNDVIQWLDKSDIFVYSSIWEEGFGISVIEAMSRGCIPVTFNKGGLPEIIEDNKDGFLVKEVSSNALAKKIEEIIHMDDLTELKENAVKKSKKFSLDKTIIGLENVYKTLI